MFHVINDRERWGSSERRVKRAISSNVQVLQRMCLQRTLHGHTGCVNTCSFGEGGSILITGSDDQQIFLWDWERGVTRLRFNSGHRNNVFQARMLPHTGGLRIVTCAADGQVRLVELPEGVSSESVTSSQLASHEGRAHKLALDPLNPQHCFYSSGEDGQVFHFDLRCGTGARQNSSSSSGSSRSGARRKLLICRGYNRTLGPTSRVVGLNAIHVNPSRPWQFAVGGDDQWARVYDIRKTRQLPNPSISQNPSGGGSSENPNNLAAVAAAAAAAAGFRGGSSSDVAAAAAAAAIGPPTRQEARDSRVYAMVDEPVARLCAEGLSQVGGRGFMGSMAPSITCVMFSQQGELLASYNDEDIYLFSTLASSGGLSSSSSSRCMERTAAATAGRATKQSRSDSPGSRQTLLQRQQATSKSPLRRSRAAAAAAAATDCECDQQQQLQHQEGIEQQQQQQQQLNHEAAEEERPRWRRRQRLVSTAGAAAARPNASAAAAAAGDEEAGSPAAAAATAVAGANVPGVDSSLHAAESSPQASSSATAAADGPTAAAAAAAASVEHNATAPAAAAAAFRGTDSPIGAAINDDYMFEMQSVRSSRIQQQQQGLAGPPACGAGRGFGIPAARFYDLQSSSRDGVVASYYGHRNAATVKGVSFFGESDEYVMSGSDCGHVYVWSKHGGEIVWWAAADLEVVNCLEPHPSMPHVLATSGIEHDVKLWAPTAAQPCPPPPHGLQASMAANRRDREAQQEALTEPEQWLLQLLAAQRRRAAAADRARRSQAAAADTPADVAAAAAAAAAAAPGRAVDMDTNDDEGDMDDDNRGNMDEHEEEEGIGDAEDDDDAADTDRDVFARFVLPGGGRVVRVRLAGRRGRGSMRGSAAEELEAYTSDAEADEEEGTSDEGEGEDDRPCYVS